MAIGVATGAFVLLLAVRRTVRRYYSKFEGTGAASFGRVPLQVASRTASSFFFVLALFVGAQVLTLGISAARVLTSAITIALFWQSGIWAMATASAWLEHKR